MMPLQHDGCDGWSITLQSWSPQVFQTQQDTPPPVGCPGSETLFSVSLNDHTQPLFMVWKQWVGWWGPWEFLGRVLFTPWGVIDGMVTSWGWASWSKWMCSKISNWKVLGWAGSILGKWVKAWVPLAVFTEIQTEVLRKRKAFWARRYSGSQDERLEGEQQDGSSL